MEQSIENRKFSFGKKLKSKNAQIDGKTSLQEIHDFIGNDDSLMCQTESIRKITDQKAYREAKLELPFVMPSGLFYQRRKTGLLSHSGFICIDIDKIENVDNVKHTLKKLPFITLMFVSPSAKGVKAFIPIDIVSAEHLEFFLALEKYFKEVHDIEIDPACKDVSRSCLISHDPHAYLNLDAETLSEGFIKKWSSISTKESAAKNSRTLEDIKFSVTHVEISEEERQQISKRLLADATNKILNAPDGKKHIILRNKSVRLGYCAHFGIINIHVAYDSLLAAISKRRVDSLVDAKKTIISGIDFGVHNAPAFKDLKLTNEPPMYVIIQDDKGDKRLHLSYTKLYRFLNFHGFWVYKKAGIRVFIKVEDNIITLVDKHDVIGFVMQYIRALPWQLADGITRDSLEEVFRKKMNVLFSENQLSTLELYYPTFNDDDPDTAYLYFSNGFLQVTKETFQLLPYSRLKGVIWDTQILDRSFTELSLGKSQLEAQSEFSKFILGVSNNREGKNPQRYQSLISIIGYLLHRYKNPSYSKAIIFCDENISASPNGGSGKSIVLKAMTKFRNTALIDGKNFSFKSQFAFQQVGLDTELMVFEDVNLSFDFERLFSVITEGLSIEKKGQDRFSISFEESPKIAIITNYMIAGNGNSHRRRKVEYEFSTFYNASNTPRQEFGHNLYDDWQDEQWNLFDNYMVSCIQFFLINGVILPPQINIAKRKLLQETCEEFVFFTETALKNFIDEEVSKTFLKNRFTNMFPEFEFKKWFSSRVFYRWLRTYAEVFELHCCERVSNNNQLILIEKK